MTDTNAVITPAANPLASLEQTLPKRPARVLPAKPAAKPAAKKAAATKKPVAKKAAAQPAPRKPATGSVKFTQAFTATFQGMLGSHGYKLADSGKADHIAFVNNGTRVDITNPQKPGGSKIAPWVVTREGGKKASGQGRDSLASELSVPRVRR